MKSTFTEAAGAEVKEEQDSEAMAGVKQEQDPEAMAGVKQEQDSEAMAEVKQEQDSEAMAEVKQEQDSEAKADDEQATHVSFKFAEKIAKFVMSYFETQQERVEEGDEVVVEDEVGGETEEEAKEGKDNTMDTTAGQYRVVRTC